MWCINHTKLPTWCTEYYLFVKYYYSPLHVSSIKYSSSGGHSCTQAAYGTVTQAFLHNAKYFFKSLYYNSGTLTARSCRILSKCNKVADSNLTQLKIFDKCILKFTYVTAYDRRPLSETHTEWNKHEVANCNQLQYAEFNTTSKTCCNRYLICVTR